MLLEVNKQLRKEIFMTELQNRIVGMLGWYHEFCVSHGLRYYCIGGPALGGRGGVGESGPKIVHGMRDKLPAVAGGALLPHHTQGGGQGEQFLEHQPAAGLPSRS